MLPIITFLLTAIALLYWVLAVYVTSPGLLVFTAMAVVVGFAVQIILLVRRKKHGDGSP